MAATVLDAFCQAITRLEAGGFEYMVTGSWAMNYWAEPRATNDIDLVVVLKESDVDRFGEAFSPDFDVDAGMALDAIHRRSMFNIFYRPFHFKFDIITYSGDLYSRKSFDRKVRVHGDADCGTGFWVSSAEDVVISKLAWYRKGNQQDGQQFDDVVNVLVTRDDLDTAYLSEWIELLDLGASFLAASTAASAEKAAR